MDLTYPPEAEAFRMEVRGLARGQPARRLGRARVPDDPRGALPSSTRSGRRSWPTGGWICASWPKEYGGRGLSIMESVVLNEEFARLNAPMRADFFGDTLVGPTILEWGSEEQKQFFLPEDPAR